MPKKATPKGEEKNKGGRPAKFESITVLQDAIASYFVEGEEKGKVSVTGLALFLGFDSRQSFYDYENKGGEFSYTIKRARLQIEQHYEEALLSKNATGAIFALKNFGWRDKVEQELTGKDGGPIETHTTLDKPLEVIIKRMDEPKPDHKQ